MKGIVFTEFIEFVEDEFGFEISNEIITESKLESGGVYTAVGTYDFQEMVSLLISLQSKTNIPIPDLLEVFGKHLFPRFVEMYPDFVQKPNGLFGFIEKIDDYIHVEVKKLYPDAELPKLTVKAKTKDAMVMIYKSERKLGDFALGLLKSAGEFFNEPMVISMQPLEEDGSVVQFTLNRADV